MTRPAPRAGLVRRAGAEPAHVQLVPDRATSGCSSPARSISQIGNWLTLVAQALLVLKLTDNNGLAVGILTACQFAPVLLLGAWAGLVADRSDKRRLLVIVQSFAMLQSFALAALAFSGNPPVLVDLRRRLRRRHRHGVRQPRPPGVRRRDGARGRTCRTRSA